MARRLLSNQDVIVEQLRADILSGRLSPGTPLRQDTLATEFGVSHIPIREALRKLEGEGLVSIKPRCGATVADLSAEEYEELSEMRVALESTALHRAGQRMTKKDLDEAAKILDRIDRKPPEEWPELNTAFHIALYRAAGRPRLLEAIKVLLHNSERYINRETHVLRNAAASQREHRRLLKLLKEGKVDEACALLSKHIVEPARVMVEHLPA